MPGTVGTVLSTLYDPNPYINSVKTVQLLSPLSNEKTEAKRVSWPQGHNRGNRFEFWHSDSTVLSHINVYTFHTCMHTQFCVLFWVTQRLHP